MKGTFTELDAFAKSANGEIEVVAGYGSVNGVYVYAFSQDVTVAAVQSVLHSVLKLKRFMNLLKKQVQPLSAFMIQMV